MLNSDFNQLEDKVDHGEISIEEMLQHMKNLLDSNQKLIEKIKQQERQNDLLSEQMSELLNKQENMKNSIESQVEEQKKMQQKIEDHEALFDKVSRQLSNLRSIIYERTHHLAEKLEDHYDFTSTYVHQLLTGKQEPLTLVLNKKNND